MRISAMGPALCLIVLVLLAPRPALGQSSDKPAKTPPGSEQVLRDIFNEVHLLRVEMLRTSVSNYRSQILLSRQDVIKRCHGDLCISLSVLQLSSRVSGRQYSLSTGDPQ